MVNSPKLKALIIDDEHKARRVLRILLEENCPEVEIVGEAEDLPGGVLKIRALDPDIVFLDIEMPGYSGTQLLDFIPPEDIHFQLVFTTAYHEFALKAFEMNAIDYLLKPLQPEQLVRAVKKAKELRGSSLIGLRLTELARSLKGEAFTKIGLPLSDGPLFVEISDLILLKAERMYTRVFTKSEGEVLVSKPLKYFNERLEGAEGFYQPHRSFLINLAHLKRYSTQDGGYIVMDNGEIANISKEKRQEFQRIVSL